MTDEARNAAALAVQDKAAGFKTKEPPTAWASGIANAAIDAYLALAKGGGELARADVVEKAALSSPADKQ